MENNEEVNNEEGKEVPEQKEDSVEELKQRLENAKAENARKAQEIQRVREELDANRRPVENAYNVNDLTTWKDHELKALLKDQQYAAAHDRATEELEKRRFNRFQAEKDESTLRMKKELERRQNYPETLDPTNPMAVRMDQIMQENHLDRTPAGRLVAARLAHLEAQQAKAVAAGRKQEQDRQADVKANFSGGTRPAPKMSDVKKLDELKKKAMAGDLEAKAEWFKHKGLI